MNILCVSLRETGDCLNFHRENVACIRPTVEYSLECGRDTAVSFKRYVTDSIASMKILAFPTLVLVFWGRAAPQPAHASGSHPCRLPGKDTAIGHWPFASNASTLLQDARVPAPGN